MLVFYILLLGPIMLQHFTMRSQTIDYKKRNNKVLAFFFVWLTTLVALRHPDIGKDTRNYIYFFSQYSKTPWLEVGKEEMELGFVYWNKIISLFTENAQIFFMMTAIVTVAMIYPTYKRLCLDPSLTIALFCTMSTFVMMFSGIRQMLSIGIGFIAYEFTRKKKLVHFIIAVISAMSFHISAFMLLFMYPLYHAKITKKWSYVAVPVLFVTFVFNKQIFSVLGSFLEKYTKYDTSIVQTGAYTMLILFAMFAVFAFIIPDESRIDQETIGLRNFLLFSVAIQMFAPLHTLAMRMNYYYIIFIPLLLPKIIEYKSERWKQIAIASRHIMMAFFLVYFFVNSNSGGNLNVFPYHFFWETV